MTVINSHPSSLRETRLNDCLNTGQPVLFSRWALDMIAHAFVQLIGSDTVDSSTTSVLTVNGHTMLVGDLIFFTDSALAGVFATVVAKTANTVTLGIDLASAPAADTPFEFYRYRPSVLDADGNMQVSIAANPTQKVSAVNFQGTVEVLDTNTTLLNPYTSRVGGWVKNIDSVDIWVSFSDEAVVGSPTLLSPGSNLPLGGANFIYTGKVSAIHDSGAGARLVEVVEL